MNLIKNCNVNNIHYKKKAIPWHVLKLSQTHRLLSNYVHIVLGVVEVLRYLVDGRLDAMSTIEKNIDISTYWELPFVTSFLSLYFLCILVLGWL